MRLGIVAESRSIVHTGTTPRLNAKAVVPIGTNSVRVKIRECYDFIFHALICQYDFSHPFVFFAPTSSTVRALKQRVRTDGLELQHTFSLHIRETHIQ